MMILRLCLLAVLAIFACATRAADAKDRLVILITIDGFADWLWDKPGLPIPVIRQMAAEGVEAEGMVVSNPSITWPNHTTLVTGVSPARHGVLFNGVLFRQAPGKAPVVEPWIDKAKMIRTPTIYDLAYKAGLTTAHVDWIPTTNSGTFHWEFPERPNPKGPIEQELVRANYLTQEQLNVFNTHNPAWIDMIWTRAAAHIIKTRKPNLLLFHLLNTDGHNHRYGPGTPASFTAFAYADTCVREILDAVNASGRAEQTTIFITADHGFKTAKRLIRPNVVLKQNQLLDSAGPTVGRCDVYARGGGGSAMLYITDPARRAELAPKLVSLFKSVEGVGRVVEPSGFHALGMPTPGENEQMGDIFLAAASGYSFSGSVIGSETVIDVSADAAAYPGNHGYLADDPELHAAFIVWGRNVKKGFKLPLIQNVDVAPTIAEALNLSTAGMDGKPLSSIWVQRP